MKKNMSNKANFQKSQMFITLMKTMNYNEKMKLNTWSKRTQSKPILEGRRDLIYYQYAKVIARRAFGAADGKEADTNLGFSIYNC
jgi:hypothetical protein